MMQADHAVRRIFTTFSIVFQLRVVTGTPRRFSLVLEFLERTFRQEIHCSR